MDSFNLRYIKTSGFITICVILGLLLYFTNEYVNSHWGVSFSVFAFVTTAFAITNRYLWNIRPFSWLYNVPDVSGTYEGTLQYEFRDDNCEVVQGKLEHIKVITQTGSDVVINSWTKKNDGTMSSKSTSIEASIIKEKDGSFSLIYNYLNDGSFEQGFSPHYGTEIFKLITDETEKFSEAETEKFIIGVAENAAKESVKIYNNPPITNLSDDIKYDMAVVTSHVVDRAKAMGAKVPEWDSKSVWKDFKEKGLGRRANERDKDKIEKDAFKRERRALSIQC